MCNSAYTVKLKLTEISRFYLEANPNTKNIQIHCFVDASKKACGDINCMLYIHNWERIHISFVCSKSRVALLKKLTLPRQNCYQSRFSEYEQNRIFNGKDGQQLLNFAEYLTAVKFWSDSMIFIHWIWGNSKKLKTFVQNRVVEICSKNNALFRVSKTLTELFRQNFWILRGRQCRCHCLSVMETAGMRLNCNWFAYSVTDFNWEPSRGNI